MLRQMANVKNGLISYCVYALIVRLMPQRNNEIEVHDERQSNKTSFFNRVYDCDGKSDCQSYSDITLTGSPLSTIYMQEGVNRIYPCPHWAEIFPAQSSGRFALIDPNFWGRKRRIFR